MVVVADLAPFDHAEVNRGAGWTGTLPLGVRSKFPPPGGFTGYEGRWPTPDDITGWRTLGFRAEGEHHDASNIALRLPAVAVVSTSTATTARPARPT